MTYELVIRGGTVIDGSGSERFRADVAVVDGRVMTIGAVPERGEEEIDASGMFVTPGFIDGHTHFDAQIFWDPLGNCASLHGVTTCVMGNCGFTLAPTPAATQDLAMRSIERAEDISRQDMLTGVPWTWNTYADYLDAVDALPKGINYAGYIGHSALRDFVMGERAFTDKATDDDIETMSTQFLITPFVGVVARTAAWVPDPREVDAVFTVALRHLRTPGVERRETWDFQGHPVQIDLYDADGHVIWGATHRITRNLLAVLDLTA